LGEAELLRVVTEPARLLSVRFETDRLAADIANRTAEESTRDAGALPLLSYLLDDMWRRMVDRGDGMLRLPAQSIELGRVLVDRANAFIARHPNSEAALRRIFTLNLATVREGGEPTRRRAWRSEFSDEEWRLVSELADHPNRLLVTATPGAGAAPLVPQMANPDSSVTPASRETYAEVAHEAIFRRWDKLREWIATEREFLAWRTGLESARRAWQATPARSKNDALLMGFALEQARKRRRARADDILESDREFIALSQKAAQRKKMRVQALVGALAAVIVLGVIAYWNAQALKGLHHWFAHVRGSVLTAQEERMLKPGDTFSECVKTDGDYSIYCPQMIVMAAGKFMMGSPATEEDRYDNEGPQHEVVIAQPFAVSKFELTFDQWDSCVQYGGCTRAASPFGAGRQSAINVSWDDAKEYVNWLSTLTGQEYRLLSEAEWEYGARAGTTSPYSFEGDESVLGEYAWYSKNSGGKTHLVGEKKPNAFGLYDVHGNVWEWVEDCYHKSYDGAPTDGSAWTTDECGNRVVRGGSWNDHSQNLRSANRNDLPAGPRVPILGIRVGRTLSAAAGAIKVAPGSH
jgi:formylglycine-generating enzyme required for sulfatase activity